MKTIIKLTLITLIFLPLISCIQIKAENTKSETIVDKIEEIVQLYTDYNGFNGSILVAHEGEVVYKKGFGLANMEWKFPMKQTLNLN